MIIDPNTKCPICDASGKDNYVSGVVHISEDIDVLYVDCINCGHSLVATNLQIFLKKEWTCYCNSFCKCKSDPVTNILCPKCKGNGSDGSRINELGNMESIVCEFCDGIGFIQKEK